MLRASPMRKCTRGLLIASLVLLTVAGPGLATSARAQTSVVQFNPTGGALTNVGPLPVAVIDELPGNAIAVGFAKPDATSPTGFRNPTVGETFTIVYQANVGSLLGSTGTPVFTYANASTGQLTAVASFTEVINSINAATGNASFSTTGAGTVQLFFNTTRVADNLAGTGFNVGTVVYQGTTLAGGPGTFTATSAPGTNAGPLDQSPNGNNYPGVLSIAGSGGSQFNTSTSIANPAFFTDGPPVSMVFSFTNTSNNLPFLQADPSAIFFNGQTGVGSVGLNNGGTDAAGNPLVANRMFQADANTSFTVAAVPEPGTISAALTGIGFAFLASLRAARRRKTSAV